MNLLLVEPERHTLEVYRDIFEFWDYKVTAVETAEEATSAATSTTFDLVILDDNLPDGSGVELILSLKESGPDIPVIVMTSNSTVRGAVNAIRAGADDYLSKSTVLEGVKHCLQEAVGKRAEGTELRKLQAETLTNIRRVRDHLNEMIDLIEQAERKQANQLGSAPYGGGAVQSPRGA